jgi:hypothetical protein
VVLFLQLLFFNVCLIHFVSQNSPCIPNSPSQFPQPYEVTGGGDFSVFSVWGQDPNSNAWDISTSFDDTGKVFTYAECLEVELALKQ